MSKIGDGIKTATNSAKEGVASVKDQTSKTAAAARSQATKAYESGREAASKGVATTKDIAARTMINSANSIDKNPLAIVLGGIALGAIVGALLPRTESEVKVLGKTGKKLNKKAKKMAEAAKDAGKNKIDSFGLNGDFVRDQFRDLVNKASEAVKAAGQAASEAAKKN